MTHLCVDARMINNSGIGVYIRHYVDFLLSAGTYEITLIGNGNEINAVDFCNRNYNVLICNAPIYSISEQLKLPFLIPSCDIFWSPHYNIPLLPIKATKRLVTIPDAAHLALSDTFDFGFLKKQYSNLVFKCAAYFSDHITTISEFSKAEIVKYTGIAPVKITSIPLGIDNKLFRKVDDKATLIATRQKYHLPEQFILFVGNVKPHKNLHSLITAFDLIKNDVPDFKLLIVGKKEGFITGDNQLLGLIDDLNLQDRVLFTGHVPLGDLPLMYNLATLFVFPSLYEGFGFPPLEAMACGCPVISSDRASMPEICGDAVQYVDIDTSNSLGNGILKVIKNVLLQKTLIEGGNKHYQKYTWEKSGEQFVTLLKSVV